MKNLRVLAVLVAATPVQGVSAPITGAETPCSIEAGRIERVHEIPVDLLNSISAVEADRWPWTVSANGKGKYLADKAAAIAEVQRLKARGIKSIDVGCMQVNLQHHPDAFTSLDEALEPSSNVA